jgi:hypothetical protein
MAASSASASCCSRSLAQASQLGWNSTDQIPFGTADNNTIIAHAHQVVVETDTLQALGDAQDLQHVESDRFK